MKHKTVKLRSNQKPQFVGSLRKRRINSMEPKRNAVKASNALLFENGYLNLHGLNNKNWLDQLESVFNLFGHGSATDHTKKIATVTAKNRRNLVTSSIRDLLAAEGLHTLSDVRPDLLPELFKIWSAKGVSGRSLSNYYSAMKWFWNIFGFEIEPMKSYGFEPWKFKSEPQKTLQEIGVNFAEVIEKFRVCDPVAACIIEAEVAKQYPSTFNANFQVLCDGEYQNFLLEIRALVPSPIYRIWARKGPAQARRRMFYVFNKLGFTKRNLGLTFSGLIKETPLC